MSPGPLGNDDLSRAWYDLKFTHEYAVAEGDAFQDLFVAVMSRAHSGDFVKVQPWGNVGDMKCDGYLESTRTVFACYAPKMFSPMAKAVAKITADHGGAVKHWKPYMDAWTFVHNDHHGLPPELLQLLLKLKTVDAAVRVDHWDHTPLLEKVRGLGIGDLVSLFGPVPTQQQVRLLRHEDLRPVVEALAGALAMAGPITDLRPVPPEKIEYNRLSDSARLIILSGIQVADRVRKFFDHWEPGVADNIAAAFRRRYEELRSQGDLSSDQILWSLYGFAGQGHLASTREQVAVLALVAFLFESCEIFERPPFVKVNA